ncbi:MAG: hypothetical protein JJ863_30490 [Deltaproteobacteria bacterium]|nr:hypothetical protein [Deltaproteobacteria bacterium]
MRGVLLSVVIVCVGCFDTLDGPLDGGEADGFWSPGPEPDHGIRPDLGRDGGRDLGSPSDGGRDLGFDGSACLPAEEMCTSFLDLDCDGRIGCRDDCDCWPSSIGPCGAADPGDELDCANGVSDDFDMLVDCADPDCVDATACGGPGRCAFQDLGSRYPVRMMVLFPVIDDAVAPSCAANPSSESTYRWVAPRSDRFRFSVNTGTVAVFAATCAGPELGCGDRSVEVSLVEGQSVIVAVSHRGCVELGIE